MLPTPEAAPLLRLEADLHPQHRLGQYVASAVTVRAIPCDAGVSAASRASGMSEDPTK